mgnify:CR=1 FL=1
MEVQKLRNRLINMYNLSNKNSAFEIISGIVAFEKSSQYIFSNCWIKMKTSAGTYSNDNRDGKIDLIDFSIENSSEKLILKFMQVED